MEPVTDLLAECERRGIRLEIQDDQVVCQTPRRDVPDDLAESLREHKSELLARLECDRLVAEMLDSVNATCPVGWTPTPGDWVRLDEIQWEIDRARDRLDVEDVRRFCGDYQQATRSIFA